MHMLYNSDSFVVVRFDVPTSNLTEQPQGHLIRGGYEIVDKFTRREIYIEGALAERFRNGVDALIETEPSEEELDDFISNFAALGQHPVMMH